MMASQDLTNNPSRFHLALALAVVKSKPEGVTIREYITKIKHHLTQGTAAENYGSNEQYLDAAGYWHKMYKDSQKEIDHLQTNLSTMEREKLRVEAEITKIRSATSDVQPTPARPSTAQPKSTSTKRKKPPVKDASALEHKKLKSGNDLDSMMGSSKPAIVPELAAFEEMAHLDSTIARHLYEIHKLHQKVSPHSSDLAYHIIQAARLTGQHVASTAIKMQEQLVEAIPTEEGKGQRAQRTANIFANINRDFRNIQRAAVRTFTLLFHGLKTLWDEATEMSRSNHGACTYEIISSIDTLLCAIETTCEIDSKMLTKEDIAAVNKDNAQTSKKSRARRINRTPVPQEVTALLLGVLSDLTVMQKAPHTAFFEGYLYLLLERTAKKLFLLTFNHPQCTNIEDDIVAGGLSDMQLDEAALCAAALEVQFLVQLLERAMTLGPYFLGSLSSTPVATSAKAVRPRTATKSNAKNNSHRTGISIAAKEKLQHTLIRCMFGNPPRSGDPTSSEGEEALNHDFIDVLKRPVQISAAPSTLKVADTADIPRWFREEVWRLIGWDILTREDGW